jgi:hypothetical protein
MPKQVVDFAEEIHRWQSLGETGLLGNRGGFRVSIVPPRLMRFQGAAGSIVPPFAAWIFTALAGTQRDPA